MASYFVSRDGKSEGPFTAEQVMAQHAGGQIQDDTLVWAEGMAEWAPYRSVGEFRGTPTGSPPVSAAPTTPGAAVSSAASGSPCDGCKAPIRDTYHEVDARKLCVSCFAAWEAEQKDGKFARVGRAALAGSGMAIACAVVWFLILKFTGYQLGLVAILVGLAVGGAVKWGAHGYGGWFYQALAVVLTYLAIATSYMPLAFEELRYQDLEAPAEAAAGETAAPSTESTAPAETPAQPPKTAAKENNLVLVAILAVITGFIAPFLNGIMGIAIVGFALFEAWKINQGGGPAVSGPFKVGASAGPAG